MQFDMFADIAPAPEAKKPLHLDEFDPGNSGWNPPAAPAIPQPPVFMREGEAFTGDNPLNLKPLRTVPADWIEGRFGYVELAEAEELNPGCSRPAVMLKLLAGKGIRMKGEIPADARELLAHIAEPCQIRKHTMLGAFVHVWQGPRKEK